MSKDPNNGAIMSDIYSNNPKDIYLVTPDLSDDNILGYAVGLRPFRKSGIRIEPEYLKNKLLIHNYGYAASGLTLCLGGAQEVIQLLRKEESYNAKFAAPQAIAILGAGVIGLSAAYELLAEGYNVNIYADEFTPNLTSNVAAGILSVPSPQSGELASQKELLNRIVNISLQRFEACLVDEEPEFMGINLLMDYRFEVPSDKIDLSNKFKDFSSEEEDVRVHFDTGLVKVGKRAECLGLDGKLFMDDLLSQVKSRGAVIHKKHFKNKNDVEALEENIIINCTSMGSQNIFDDHEFMPVRGHLIYFKLQVGMNYSMYQPVPQHTDYWVKLYPWHDRLILGGVFEQGVNECIQDKNVINTLLKYARACL